MKRGGSKGADRVLRFNRTERLVHAVQAVTFLLLLFTGLSISLTFMETWIGHRALLREIHLSTAFFFVFGPGLIALAGDRLSIKRDIDEVDSWSRNDLQWLRQPAADPGVFTPPAGRYNAGQKLNAVFTVYCTVAFGATGLILWQNRRFPYQLVSAANTVHQWLAYIALIAFLGHIYLAVVHPATRAALAGILGGTVIAEWAEHHHPLWRPEILREPPIRLANLARSALLLLLGLESAALLTRWGFAWLGANSTDPVIKALYQLTALPGAISNPMTASHQFDLAALIWGGLLAAVFYAISRRSTLILSPIPSPASD